MSMYNLLFGQNPMSDIILVTLGLTRSDCGRFRDTFVSEGKIAVYTRLGGGNRECYCESEEEHARGGCYGPVIERLQAHPRYLYDKDDDFDCTYATFWFSFPDEYSDLLQLLDRNSLLQLLDKNSLFDPDKRWEEKLEAIKNSSAGELRQQYPGLVEMLERLLAEGTP